MADKRCHDVVTMIFLVVLCAFVDRSKSQHQCLFGTLTSENLRADLLKSNPCVTPTHLPSTPQPAVTPQVPTASSPVTSQSITKQIQSTTLNITTNAALSSQTTTTTVAVQQSPSSSSSPSPSPSLSPSLSLSPSSTSDSSYSTKLNIDTKPSTETPQSADKTDDDNDDDTTTQGGSRRRRDADDNVQSSTCMIFKYFNTDDLIVNAKTIWTAEFACDSTGLCKNQKGCQDVQNIQFKGKSSGRLCCCEGKDCNKPTTLGIPDDQLYPGLQDCYTDNTINKTVPFMKTSCKNENSQFCINVTKAKTTSYHCSNAFYEKICVDNSLTNNSCYTGPLNGESEDSTICCCKDNDCNADPNFVTQNQSRMFNYNIVIYVLSTLIIVVLIITVILLLVRRRKSPMDPDMVQITYSRLTADLADG
ncbi:uncharacterized protein LOC144446679 [Glandiceps talaboti]